MGGIGSDPKWDIMNYTAEAVKVATACGLVHQLKSLQPISLLIDVYRIYSILMHT